MPPRYRAHQSHLRRTAFDFDEWEKLARTDPEEFEARRRSAIESFIRSVPAGHRPRLRGLQFRIDMERRRARTPMAACVRLSSMLWDSVFGHDGLQDQLHRLLELTAVEPRQAGRDNEDGPRPLAKLLKFPADECSSRQKK